MIFSGLPCCVPSMVTTQGGFETPVHLRSRWTSSRGRSEMMTRTRSFGLAPLPSSQNEALQTMRPGPTVAVCASAAVLRMHPVSSRGCH